MAELDAVFDRRFNARVRSDLTSDVLDELLRNPLGPHTDTASRVRRALGSMTITGKQLILSLGPDGPWAIGVVTVGAPGNLVVDTDAHHSYEDAMRVIFANRAAQFAGPVGTEGTSHGN
ncbi:hypothetical protein [Aeromicrobium sp. Root344]|uniref:hypothetical protein n=1 Tax=Aeromicrobium sp. Root344 TaxID=1736521 RepID=UPI0012F95E80|nr:hypothetical protein [Aeromicrobium sp. Root344]